MPEAAVRENTAHTRYLDFPVRQRDFDTKRSRLNLPPDFLDAATQLLRNS
jgi:hypothetical protein